MDAEAIAGRYRRGDRLGVGGMAEVWAAEDEELGRRVAIKFLGAGADRERFEREARAAASLSHPNICQVYDYGVAEGRPYIVLEYLGGGTLEDRLAPGTPLPVEDVGRIAREVAAGLAHAHEQGVVHRDLKPANILFDADGRAKIADFGIARLDDSGTITKAGTLLGTAAYISPEQASGETATSASDVYSFGVILFRMLSGRLPFESAEALELVQMHRDTSPPSLAALRPDVPPALESLAMAALAKSPADRPADGTELLAELGDEEPTTWLPGTQETEATRVLPFAERRPGAARPRRFPRAAWLGLVVALLAAGVAAAFVATRGGSTSAPPATRTRSTPSAVTTAPGSSAPASTASVVTTAPPVTETGGTSTAVTEPTITIVPPTVPVTTAQATTAPATTAPTTTSLPTTLPTTEPATTYLPPSTEVTTTEPPPATTTEQTTTTVAGGTGAATTGEAP